MGGTATARRAGDVLRPRPAEILPGEGGGRALGVLVIPSWWGLTGAFRRYGAALARDGFTVGLADPFDGRRPADAAEARGLRAMRRAEPMYRTLIRNIAEVRQAGGCPRVALVGFSMGGHWAVWLSQRPDLPVAAAVLYYAARAGGFAQGRAAYLAHFAAEDAWVSPAARKRMEAAIIRAGRPYAAHDYPATQHNFAEDDRPEHDPGAAALALARTLAHLRAVDGGKAVPG